MLRIEESDENVIQACERLTPAPPRLQTPRRNACSQERRGIWTNGVLFSFHIEQRLHDGMDKDMDPSPAHPRHRPEERVWTRGVARLADSSVAFRRRIRDVVIGQPGWKLVDACVGGVSKFQGLLAITLAEMEMGTFASSERSDCLQRQAAASNPAQCAHGSPSIST